MLARGLLRCQVSSIRRLCTALSQPVALPEGVSILRLPSLIDVNIGTVDRWLKKEGESFRAGEPICVASIGDVTIGINVPEDGILTRILANESYKEIKAGEPIAIYADNKETMMNYIENERIAVHDSEKQAEIDVVMEQKAKQPDTKTLLREIRHLINEGAIVDGSDFAKKLLSLARHGDKELMLVFEASFEDKNFLEDNFDKKFFLENSRDVVQEHLDAEKKQQG